MINRNPTQEQLRALWDACMAWRDSVKPICAESIYQSDEPQIRAPELAAKVCGILGYPDLCCDCGQEKPESAEGWVDDRCAQCVRDYVTNNTEAE